MSEETDANYWFRWQSERPQRDFVWLVSNQTDEILVEGAGPVNGPYDTANSTRCELGGTWPRLSLYLFYTLYGEKVTNAPFDG